MDFNPWDRKSGVESYKDLFAQEFARGGSKIGVEVKGDLVDDDFLSKLRRADENISMSRKRAFVQRLQQIDKEASSIFSSEKMDSIGEKCKEIAMKFPRFESNYTENEASNQSTCLILSPANRRKLLCLLSDVQRAGDFKLSKFDVEVDLKNVLLNSKLLALKTMNRLADIEERIEMINPNTIDEIEVGDK